MGEKHSQNERTLSETMKCLFATFIGGKGKRSLDLLPWCPASQRLWSTGWGRGEILVLVQYEVSEEGTLEDVEKRKVKLGDRNSMYWDVGLLRH